MVKAGDSYLFEVLFLVSHWPRKAVPPILHGLFCDDRFFIHHFTSLNNVILGVLFIDRPLPILILCVQRPAWWIMARCLGPRFILGFFVQQPTFISWRKDWRCSWGRYPQWPCPLMGCCTHVFEKSVSWTALISVWTMWSSVVVAVAENLA